MTAVVAGALVCLAAPAAVAPAPARADTVPTSYGAPSWWKGDCDTDNWTAKARAAGWTGQAAGRLGGQVLGIPVCGPRNLAGAPNIWWSRAGWGELEWQCVEFAMRFMVQVYGVTPYGANGVDVVSNYRSSSGGGLVRVDNGTVGKAPTPGDIVSFSSPSNVYGHVAVVASTSIDANGNGTVRLATQNDTPDGWRTLTISNWTMSAFGSLSPYAWLHDPLGRGGNGLSDGAFVVYQNAVYRIAGGAPVYVSSWAPFGAQPYAVLTDAQWNSLRTVPRDGTYLREAGGDRIYRVVGGHPMWVSSCAPAGLSGCGAFVEVDPVAIANAGAGGLWNHLTATIADSAFVRVADGAKVGLVTRAAGTALLGLSDCGPLGGCAGYVDVNQPAFDAYTAAHPTPVDGTLVQSLPSGTLRSYGGGVCRVAPPGTSTAGAVVVNDLSLTCTSPLQATGVPTNTLVVGRSVATTLSATGGSGSYTWSTTSPLPPGLSLAASGALTGTPTGAGSWGVTFHLVDARYPSDATDVVAVLTVVPVLTATPATATLPVGPTTVVLGGSAAVSGAVVGGSGALSYRVSAGQLPPGLSLTTDGQLTGTVTTVGQWTATLTVTDASTPTQSVTQTLTVMTVPSGGFSIPTDPSGG